MNSTVFKLLVTCSCVCSLLYSQENSKERLSSQLNPNYSQIDTKKAQDSLLKIIRVTKSDTGKIKIYLNVCEVCNVSENLTYTNKIHKLIDNLLKKTRDEKLINQLIGWEYETIDYEKYYFNTYSKSVEIENIYKKFIEKALYYKCYDYYSQSVIQLGDYYAGRGELINKLKVFEVGLKNCELAKNYKSCSRFLIQLAFFYAENKDTTAALLYINKATENEKFIRDESRKNRGYVILGNLFRDLGKYNEALKQYQLGLTAYGKIKDLGALADIYLQMGFLYRDSKQYVEALNALTKGEEIANRFDDLNFLAVFIVHKGEVMAKMGNFQDAIKEHGWLWDKLLPFYGKSDNEPFIFVGSHLANDYLLANEFKNAKKVLDKIIPICTDAKTNMNLEKMAFTADSALGNFKEALIHQLKYFGLKEKYSDAEIAKSGATQKFKDELEKNKLEFENQNFVASEEKKKQTIILYSITCVTLLIAFLTFVVFRNLQKSKKANTIIAKQKNEVEIQKKMVEDQKHLVDEKQKEILDSISYAKRLQEAILPPQKFLDENLKSNFILYQPKDIVAGDFYWAEKINNFFFIAVADSTGHGVPGAMVSVVCSNALNRSVKEFQLHDTGKILDKTRELVIETFAKSNSEVKDGMDISLLCIDQEKKIINWSGANNPLWYIQNKKLEQITANKQPIGSSENEFPFTQHSIPYISGTILYLFTDGYADQFGGPKGKKFKYKQLSELLFSIHEYPMEKQKEVVTETFENWKNDLEQVDDVCVVGIQL